MLMIWELQGVTFRGNIQPTIGCMEIRVEAKAENF